MIQIGFVLEQLLNREIRFCLYAQGHADMRTSVRKPIMMHTCSDVAKERRTVAFTILLHRHLFHLQQVLQPR
jgi:hypothetical protein